MARIYSPRQRAADKRWDMCVGSDEEHWVHAIGYCAGWFEWTEEMATRIGMTLEHCLKDQAKLLPVKHKFHTDGHDSSREASDCWHEYRLDVELEFRRVEDERRKCQVCGDWTQTVADFGREFSERYWLCEAHATRLHVAQLSRE